MKKRGMVSVFIIAGLFILIIFALVYSFYQGIIPAPNFLSKKSDAVTTYTESCMDGIARNGLEIMSIQGGYITIPDNLKRSGSFVPMGFEVPYWYYRGRDMAPSVQQMDQQLGDYISENLPDCLDSFKAFPDYEIVPQTNISTDASIGDNVVSIKTNFRLKVRHPGEDQEYVYLDDFTVDIKSDYGKMYKLSRELIGYENSVGFLENYTDEMIACSDYLPYEGMDLTCKPMVWRVSDMENYTKTMIMYNLHYLQFENTDYKESGIPYYDKQYKVPFTANDYRKFKVSVVYNPSWDMDFSVIPSSNGFTKPFEFSLSKVLMSCVKIFHHKYTLDYPVIFQITDDNDPESKFYFATPVIMRRGIPNRYNEVPPWPTDYDQTMNSDYCSNYTKVTMFTLDQSGFIHSTPSIRDNRQYSLNVYARDAVTGEILQGANISYQCVQFRCPIGRTQYPMQGPFLTGASPVLDARFPDCLGGLVIADKKGYQEAVTRMTVGPDTDGSQVTVDMHPLKQFDYRVQVVEDHNGIITRRNLKPEEYVMIDIRNNDQNFEDTIVYPSDSKYYSDLELMQGDFTYSLDIKLVTKDSYLGGLALNWTPSKDELATGRFVLFYVVKKDTLIAPQTPEEFQSLIDYATENSEKYPPVIR